ncbi:leucine-rich repeat-containing protein 74B-like [Ruditapes philippinarum]|uniref:leucine-rich repeat-containing protein 74B-like n=1 Tax=Ruditapes philippinarum TaxID=129788 RepID=UPI00295BB957|nr:leucine-rich repeat-containing protein 74B-like [Ruditapes philippinarum]
MSGQNGPTLEFREDSSTGTATPKDFRYFNMDRGDTELSLVERQQSFLESVAEEDSGSQTERRVQIDIMDDSGRKSEMDDRKSVNSTRMPKNMTRAMLVRTPANKDDAPEPPHEEEIQEHTEQQEPDILITELKEQPPDIVEGDADEESDIEPEYQQVTVETVDAEEDWDTDLEIEDEMMKEVRNHDPSGRSYYDKVCSRMGLVPVSYIKRHITDNEITMRFHGLGSSATKAIALVLRDNITLEKLNLQGNWIEGDGGLAMARMLEENDYITELVLSDNKLGTVGAQCMCKMLSVNAGLRKLDLSGESQINSTLESTNIKIYIHVFWHSYAPIFADALENAKYLKELYLSRNMFGSEAGEILGPAISKIFYVTLYKEKNSWKRTIFEEKGAIAVAKGIGENVRLKSCDISWNGFGPEGGAAVADAMISNNSLVELDISGNRLTADTAMKIARMIASNDNIRKISIGNNILTTAGAIALATAVNNGDSSELEELDLTDVPIEFEFLRIFKRKIKIEDLAVPFNKPKLQDAVTRLADTQEGRIYFGDFIKQQQNEMKTKSGGEDEEIQGPTE